MADVESIRGDDGLMIFRRFIITVETEFQPTIKADLEELFDDAGWDLDKIEILVVPDLSED
jgi:hypothetical protein